MGGLDGGETLGVSREIKRRGKMAKKNGEVTSSTIQRPIPALEEGEEYVEEGGWLLMIGTLQEGEPITEKKRIPVKRLKPLRGWKVPSRSKGFIQCQESSGEKKTWMVTAMNGLGKGRGWAIPACLIASENGVGHIPVIHADERPPSSCGAESIS